MDDIKRLKSLAGILRESVQVIPAIGGNNNTDMQTADKEFNKAVTGISQLFDSMEPINENSGLQTWQRDSLADLYVFKLNKTSNRDKAKQETIDSLFSGGVIGPKQVEIAKQFLIDFDEDETFPPESEDQRYNDDSSSENMMLGLEEIETNGESTMELTENDYNLAVSQALTSFEHAVMLYGMEPELAYDKISVNLNDEDLETFRAALEAQGALDADEAENMEYDDSMDGDFDSAMASAGHGSDEDYGGDDFPMEENLNNGYYDVNIASGNDFFPNGADGPVVSAAGPSGARQGDNPEQKKMQVAEVHKELVYGYRKFLKESLPKILNSTGYDMISSGTSLTDNIPYTLFKAKKDGKSFGLKSDYDQYLIELRNEDFDVLFDGADLDDIAEDIIKNGPEILKGDGYWAEPAKIFKIKFPYIYLRQLRRFD